MTRLSLVLVAATAGVALSSLAEAQPRRSKLSPELRRWASSPPARGFWGKGPAPVTVSFENNRSRADLAWLRSASTRLEGERGNLVDVRVDRAQLATIAADRRVEALWINYKTGLTRRPDQALNASTEIGSWLDSGEPFVCMGTVDQTRPTSRPRISVFFKGPATRSARRLLRRLYADEVSPDFFTVHLRKEQVRSIVELAGVSELGSECNQKAQKALSGAGFGSNAGGLDTMGR